MSEKFKWIKWNIEHIALKGITPEEAESALANPFQGYPRRFKEGYVVWGQSELDRFLQIAFAREDDGRIFVFHARLLKANEKRRCRKQ